MTLAEQQAIKERKKRLDVMQRLRNRVTTYFSFKQIKTWGDVEKYVPFPAGFTPPPLDKAIIDIKEFKELFDILYASVDKPSASTNVSSSPVSSSPAVLVHDTPNLPVIPPTVILGITPPSITTSNPPTNKEDILTTKTIIAETPAELP